MKRISTLTLMVFLGVIAIMAQAKAEITFEKTTHDFETFSENDPKVTCTFKFTNTGDAALVIHQAVASCGCTVPDFTKEPVKPGESGEIKVTYNGAGRYPGRFRKTITVHSNATNDVVRLYIKGNMTAKDLDLQKAIEEVEKKSEQAVEEPAATH